MKYYAHYGHKDFVLCLGYKGEMIKQFFLNYNECMSNDFVLSQGGKKLQPMPLNQLPQHLQQLPVVDVTVNKGWMKAKAGNGDHSNTQFAMLALWTARRHDVPAAYQRQSTILSWPRREARKPSC